MRAHIKLELFGENYRQMHVFYTKMTNEVVPGLGDLTFGKGFPKSCWVAKITGLHPKWKFEREFLKPSRDYSKSNSKGSRGVFDSYYPEYNFIHEVKAKYSWGSEERYFCTFDENGEHRLTEKEVIECLKNNHWV